MKAQVLRAPDIRSELPPEQEQQPSTPTSKLPSNRACDGEHAGAQAPCPKVTVDGAAHQTPALRF